MATMAQPREMQEPASPAPEFDAVFAHKLPRGTWVVAVSKEGGPTAIARGAAGESFDVVLDSAIIDLGRRLR